MKRNHEELVKNDFLRSRPSGIVFNLRFTDADEVKCHVQQVHPEGIFQYTLICVLENLPKRIITFSGCETSGDEFGAPTSEKIKIRDRDL